MQGTHVRCTTSARSRIVGATQSATYRDVGAQDELRIPFITNPGERIRMEWTLADGSLREVAWPAEVQPLIYVCGPTRLVESVAATLVVIGHAPERIKTERFGPTGT